MIDLLSVDFSDYVKVEKLSEQNVPLCVILSRSLLMKNLMYLLLISLFQIFRR